MFNFPPTMPQALQDLLRAQAQNVLFRGDAIIARKPDPRIVAMRPRTVDAEAYKAEQEAWDTWNDMHLESEAGFNAPRTVPWRGDDPVSGGA